MNTLTKLLPLVAFLKIAFSCPDDCSFAKEDSNIPAKGIGIDWGVFFSQIQVKDIRFFGLGIENYFFTLATIFITRVQSQSYCY